MGISSRQRQLIWANAIEETNTLANACLERSPTYGFAPEVRKTLEAIGSILPELVETLRTESRVPRQQVFPFAGAATALYRISRLAIELPGIHDQRLWNRSEQILPIVSDAAHYLVELAEGIDWDATMVLHASRIPFPMPNPVLDRRGRIPIVPNIRADVWDKSRGHCWYCGVAMHPFHNFHVDHFIPVADGGSNDLMNLVPSCQSCNARKGARTAEYLRRFLGTGRFWFEDQETGR